MRFCVNLPEDQVIRPEAVAAIRRVRAVGIKVGILTNDLAAFVGAEWKDEVAFFREIDAFTDVSYGAMKPDSRAYHEALKNLGTTAIETLFVDAQAHNVRGAARRSAWIQFVSMWDDRPRYGLRSRRRCWATLARQRIIDNKPS